MGGAARELVLARQFGTGDVIDCYLIAFLLPSFAINLVAGSFNAALVPRYVKVRDTAGEEEAQRLLGTVSLISLVLLGAIAAVLVLAAPVTTPLLAPGFGAAKIDLAVRFHRVLAPAIVLSGTSTIWSAVLNARERFAMPALTGLLVPAAVLAALLALRGAWADGVLVYGTLTGYGLECAALGFLLARSGASLAPRWHGPSPNVSHVISQYRPMLAGALVMTLNPVIDQVMAARFGAGSVAALGYGNKLVSFGMGILSVAVSTAVLPQFSRLTAAQDWAGIRHLLRSYAVLVFVAACAASALGVAASVPIARLLYERGAFSPSDTVLVSRIQSFYLLQLPFHATGIVFVRLVSAMSANRFLAVTSVVGAIVNVVGNVVLGRALGVAGIALSTAVVYLSSFVLLVSFVAARLPRAETLTAPAPAPATRDIL
jgi:putative peptidoglycan lipid II flippase